MPLEGLQRHSSVRKGQKQVNCRIDAAGGSPAALKRHPVPLQRQKSPWTSQEAIRTPSDNQKPAISWAEFCHETRNLLRNPLTLTQRHSLSYRYQRQGRQQTMMTVNEVSKLTGVSIRTLQYYDKIGLLHPAEYTEAGYRLYDDAMRLWRLCSKSCYSENWNSL